MIILSLSTNITIGQNKKVDCEKAVTQMELNLCAKQHYENSQRLLDSLYKKLLTLVEERQNNYETENQLTGKKLILSLIGSQDIWKKYRDSYAGFYSSIYQGGSMQPMVYYNIMTRITKNRLSELSELLEEISM